MYVVLGLLRFKTIGWDNIFGSDLYAPVVDSRYLYSSIKNGGNILGVVELIMCNNSSAWLRGECNGVNNEYCRYTLQRLAAH